MSMRHLDAVLSPAVLAQIRKLCARHPFVNGLATAGGAAAAVKRNEQLSSDNQTSAQLAALVIEALKRDFRFFRIALPVEISQPMVNRYGVGMKYGPHYDSLLFNAPDGRRMRADMSATLFISDPADYDGGELVDCQSGRHVKLAAGDMVLYPTGVLHEVTRVTRGERLAVILWIQSMVQDHARRDILSNLDFAIEDVASQLPERESVRTLSGAFANLGRMWMVP